MNPTPDYYAKRLTLTEAEKAQGWVLLDPARIAEVYPAVKGEPMLFTALKKLCCPGERGAKSRHRDIDQIIGALQRWKELNPEEEEIRWRELEEHEVIEDGDEYALDEAWYATGDGGRGIRVRDTNRTYRRRIA